MTSKVAALHQHMRNHPLTRKTHSLFSEHLKIIDIAGIIIVSTAVLSIVVQLLYPADRALPLMKIGGLEVGGSDRAAIVAQLDNFAQNGKVTLKTPNKTQQTSWSAIGVAIDREASATAALDYMVWERLIPFSGLARINQAQNMPMLAIVDPERLKVFAKRLVKEDRAATVDASIKVVDGKVTLNEAKNGYRFAIDDVKQQIQGALVANGTTIELQPLQVGEPRIRPELAGLKTQAEAILQHQLVLTVEGKEYRPNAKTVGSWITFVEGKKTKKLNLRFNHKTMSSYLKQVNKQSGIAPGTAVVTLLDGAEVARTKARSGRSVVMDKSIVRIEQALKSPTLQHTLALAITDVPPYLTYSRTYSNSNAGLMSIVNDWANSHYGNYAVIVRELGGKKRSAELQPDKSYVTASTFKMFVAYVLLTKIEQGRISFNQSTDMGWTVEACLVEMIVNSTNPCAISLMNLMGWQETENMIRAAGFTATTVNNQGGGDKFSTVRDETNFLMRLNAGTLMGKGSTDYLLGLLKRQVWRAGIPSGVPPGIVVADKVGLYNGWVHDVAIVYAPKGTYILGIMSQGGSDPAFADLSRRIYEFFD